MAGRLNFPVGNCHGSSPSDSNSRISGTDARHLAAYRIPDEPASHSGFDAFFNNDHTRCVCTRCDLPFFVADSSSEQLHSIGRRYRLVRGWLLGGFMAIYYHFASRSFLDTATYAAKSIPSDAIEITKEERVMLLTGEASGQSIVLNDQGRPVLVEPTPDPEAIANQERFWRDAELDSVKWLRERHRDELELAIQTSLTAAQYSELLAYVQLLRDWPQSPNFPSQEYRPTEPGWIAEQESE
ncbi:hypothetical protein C6Q18_22875 [Pseudomonas chlororaphis subsp. piscium]|nr:hypothetical protein C6Q18_22875 [Pseudomonas chlororaphis subsp. piscium]